MEEFYKECEFEIRVYKTKDMQFSKQIITGNCREGILTGIASLLLSTLDTKLMIEADLKDMVKFVLERRKEGARNNVIYNSLEANYG